MKIGLITIHFQNNLGAVLQTYATQKYLSAFGDVEVIDYHHNISVVKRNNFRNKINYQLIRLKKLLHPIQFLLSKKRAKVFNAFRKQYIKTSEKVYRGDNDILIQPPIYDRYVCGSDQIWNTSITNNSSAYFLSFTDSKYKYAFASSIGHSNMMEEEKILAKKYLLSFKQISVREQESAIELNKLLNIPVQTVLDPVFLLIKEEWLSIVKPITIPKRDFIVVYAMQDNIALNLAVKYAKNLKMPIISIGKKLKSINKNILNAGPQEFLYVLSKAKYVITNSFHGFAFSLIFQKRIFVCEHTTHNLRLVNLLEQIDCKEKQITAKTKYVSQCEIDGEKSYNKLNIQYSKDYLKSIFKE